MGGGKGLPDGAQVYAKGDAEIWAMGSTHGARHWKGQHVILEWAGPTHPSALRLPGKYLAPLARHHWDGAPIDAGLRGFTVNAVLAAVGRLLVKYCVCWPPAVGKLGAYDIPHGSTGTDAPAVLEVGFEQQFAPKAMCQASRRADLEAAHKDGTDGGGAVIPDCVVREAMVRLSEIGVGVTWARDAEFDGTGTFRAAQGSRVIVESGDLDMPAHIFGRADCTGVVLLKGKTAGDLHVFGAEHKVNAMSRFWVVDPAAVRNHFLAFEVMTLAAVLLGPHDYHFDLADGKYSNATGNRYKSIVKVVRPWLDALRAALTTGNYPTTARDVAEAVVKCFMTQWPAAGGVREKIGHLSFEKFEHAFRGFVDQPVAFDVGPDQPSVPYVDALDRHCLTPPTPGVAAGGSGVDADKARAYTYEGKCQNCVHGEKPWEPPEFPIKGTADGPDRVLIEGKAKPRINTCDVCRHFTQYMYRIEGAQPGTYDPFTAIMELCTRLGVTSEIVKWAWLEPSEDPRGRDSLAADRRLIYLLFRVPQSFGSQDKTKHRDKKGHYDVRCVLELDMSSGRMVRDGILWYNCGCHNGMKLCRHVQTMLVALSRIGEDDFTNHSFVRYWAPKTHAAGETKAVMLEDLMVERVYLSDLLGRKATDDDVAKLM
jgi:hypothetical protein